MTFISLYGASEHSIGWLAVLFDASVKSIVVFALAAVLSLALKRGSAAFRHLMWSLVVVGCLCLPVISVTLPSWWLPVASRTIPLSEAAPGFEGNLNVPQSPSAGDRGETPRQGGPQVDSIHETAGLSDMVQEESIISTSQAPGWWTPSTLWTCIGIVWSIGALVALLPLLAGFFGIWRIARKSRRITDGSLAALLDELLRRLRIKRRVSLLRSEVEMPLTWGIIRPQVLIPADAENWSTDQQRSVLLHELAHIQRWDWLTQTVAQISCAIYWFNPLVWVADRRMRLERERACDDHVLTNGCWATDYASHLLEIARVSRPSIFAERAAVAMAQPSWIENRLRVILATDRNRRRLKKGAVSVSVLSFACLVLAIGVMRPTEAVEREELLQQIRKAVLLKSDPTEKPPTDTGVESIENQPTNRIKYGLELTEKFFSIYPESKQLDEAWRHRIVCQLRLHKKRQANAEIKAFLKAFPKSKYAPEVLSLKVDQFEQEGKYMEALAELDKINHSALLPRAYEAKAQLFSLMEDWEKAAEYRLRAAELMYGNPAPDFTLKDINGETVSLKDFRGKVVLLDFWATTCGPCITEIPNLRTLYEEHHPDLVLISISLDANDDPLVKFLEDNDMPWIHIRSNLAMPVKYNVSYIPHYRVIDRNGLMRGKSLHDEIGLNTVVSSQLAETPDERDSVSIAKLHRLRAELHDLRGEREQAITEYAHALRLQPNDIQLVTPLARLYGDDQSEKVLALYDEALPKLVEADESQTGADFTLGEAAFDFAMFYDEQGNAEKCWQAFEIAMENSSDGYLTTRIKGLTGRFSTIRGRSGFKALTGAPPGAE